MFENLTAKLGNVISKFSGRTGISDYDVKSLLKDFRKTLLDADVSWVVVKHLITKLHNKLIEKEITKKVSHKDIFTKIVIDEFLSILNTAGLIDYDKLFSKSEFYIILFLGLNGVGKTTSLVKLANLIKCTKNKSVLVVSCDIYRPAAIDQLKILCNKSNIDCFLDFVLSDHPSFIVDKAISHAKSNGYDFLIIDSSGRSHTNQDMMAELSDLVKRIKPSYSFLVVDSLVGQDGVRSADAFCKSVNISGFFLTKMDSDVKGGVLLSLSFLIKKPIYFLGVGEKVDDISFFYPDRLVSRMLGFGDVSSLLDDINRTVNVGKLSKINDLELVSFDLNEFKKQLTYLIDLGGFSKIVDKFPGGYSLNKSLVDKFNDKFFVKMISIINSMTIKERKFSNIINGSRKKRIASGAGVALHDVSTMLKYYDKMKKIFIKMDNEKSFSNVFKKIFF